MYTFILIILIIIIIYLLRENFTIEPVNRLDIRITALEKQVKENTDKIAEAEKELEEATQQSK